jgi:hypothetical protein
MVQCRKVGTVDVQQQVNKTALNQVLYVTGPIVKSPHIAINELPDVRKIQPRQFLQVKSSYSYSQDRVYLAR